MRPPETDSRAAVNANRLQRINGLPASLALLLACASLPLTALAASPDLPPPPEAPAYTEPRALTHRLQVQTRECEQGPLDSDFGFRSTWLVEDSTLELAGWVHHGGSESIDAESTLAWLVDDRLVVLYRLRAHGDGFPEAPILICPAYTHLQISIQLDAPPPSEVTIYPARSQVGEPTRIGITTGH